jgi:hypothetical protein
VARDPGDENHNARWCATSVAARPPWELAIAPETPAVHGQQERQPLSGEPDVDARDRAADERDAAADRRDRRADQRDREADSREHASRLVRGDAVPQGALDTPRLIRAADLRDQAAEHRDARARAREEAAADASAEDAVSIAAASRLENLIDRLWAARDRDAALDDRLALFAAEDVSHESDGDAGLQRAESAMDRMDSLGDRSSSAHDRKVSGEERSMP